MSYRTKYFSAYNCALFILGMYVIIALLAPIISNHLPLVCKGKDGWIYPFFFEKDKQVFTTGKLKRVDCVMAVIPFSSNTTNLKIASMSPSEAMKMNDVKGRHWLGTDELGRDVAAGLIHGTKTAIQIGFISVLLSFLLGVSIGMMAAYFRDDGLKMNVLQMIIFFLSIFTIGFYFIYEIVFSGVSLWLIVFMFSLFFIINFISLYYFSITEIKKYSIDFDTLLVKVIELRKSFPGLFILLALTGLFAIPSIWNIIFIITLLGWTEFARFARAETLAVKNENYIMAAQILGFNHFRILFRHILPNIWTSLIVIACFSIGSAIILESTLSFLGIGMPLDQVTWGKMMAEGRNMNRWWLVVFPGICLFVIILCLNAIAAHNNKKTSW